MRIWPREGNQTTYLLTLPVPLTAQELFEPIQSMLTRPNPVYPGKCITSQIKRALSESKRARKRIKTARACRSVGTAHPSFKSASTVFSEPPIRFCAPALIGTSD